MGNAKALRGRIPAPRAQRYDATGSLSRILRRLGLERQRPLATDSDHSLDRQSRSCGDLGLDCDVVLQSLEGSKHLWQRRHFHESADGEVTRRIEPLRRILTPKPMKDSYLGRYNEILSIGYL